MALRDQPYIPIYVDDFLTDEKLLFCSPEANGVYIRIMLLMHKNVDYGIILLKQKFKQHDKPYLNFALQLAQQLPRSYSMEVIEASLHELIENDVLRLEGEDKLVQKRMVKDNDLSITRALNGRKGGKKTQEIAKELAKAKEQAGASKFAKAKSEASTVNEYVYVNEDVDVIKEDNKEEKEIDKFKADREEVVNYLNEKAKRNYKASSSSTSKFINARFKDGYTVEDMKRVIDNRVADWLGKDMEKYLRPETLFNEQKFQGYVNERSKNEISNGNNGTVPAGVGTKL